MAKGYIGSKTKWYDWPIVQLLKLYKYEGFTIVDAPYSIELSQDDFDLLRMSGEITFKRTDLQS